MSLSIILEFLVSASIHATSVSNFVRWIHSLPLVVSPLPFHPPQISTMKTTSFSFAASILALAALASAQSTDPNPVGPLSTNNAQSACVQYGDCKYHSPCMSLTVPFSQHAHLTPSVPCATHQAQISQLVTLTRQLRKKVPSLLLHPVFEPPLQRIQPDQQRPSLRSHHLVQRQHTRLCSLKEKSEVAKAIPASL